MARRDTYHDIVRTALEADGWTITDDPLYLEVEEVRFQIDLGASQSIAAEKNGEKIAVEIKSFVGPSDINELQKAIGQYLLYVSILMEDEPDRTLYLAVPESAYSSVFSKQFVNRVIATHEIRLIVFHAMEERITQWINEKNT
jgi:hypothetical protein